jgi:hypothetical protein
MSFKDNRNPFNVYELAWWLRENKEFNEAVTLYNEYLTMDLSWSDLGKGAAFYNLNLIEEEQKQM